MNFSAQSIESQFQQQVDFSELIVICVEFHLSRLSLLHFVISLLTITLHSWLISSPNIKFTRQTNKNTFLLNVILKFFNQKIVFDECFKN